MRSFRRSLAVATAFCALILVSAGAAKATDRVTFHFYGAVDCPPCMAFKRDSLPLVRSAAEEAGFDVAVNIIDRTRDVSRVGAYGAADGVLRAALEQRGRAYPPVYFTTRGSEVLSVHGSDWRAALESAREQASGS